jgi:Phospholipid methyltransferase
VSVALPAAILVFADGLKIGWGLDGVTAGLPVLLGLGLIAAGSRSGWDGGTLGADREGDPCALGPHPAPRGGCPYGYLRNPMITGVLAVLLGAAAVLGSPALLIWCTVFLASNWAFFLLPEEPGLVRRFGDGYGEHKRNVPRWISRRTPCAPGR